VSNTSATGGYLRQTTGPVDNLDFRRFVGTVLVGISGFAPELVRPAWQPNPAPIPGIDTDWMAFGQTSRRIDYDAFQGESVDGTLTTQTRHEEIDFVLTFYGPNCLGKASELRDAADITQNQSALYLAGMAIVDFTDITHAPELVNERWFDRCDMTMTIRREIRREYRILNFVSAYGTTYANQGISTLSRDWAT
jgi:hypothetical protein